MLTAVDVGVRWKTTVGAQFIAPANSSCFHLMEIALMEMGQGDHLKRLARI